MKKEVKSATKFIFLFIVFEYLALPAMAMSRMPSLFRGSGNFSSSSNDPIRSTNPADYNLNDRTCVAGNGASMELANSFHQYSEPATSRFQSMIQNGHRPACAAGSPLQVSSSQMRAANDLSAVADRLRQSAFPIRSDCFIAAMSRQSGTSAYFCPTSEGAGTSMNNNQCFTRPMIDYIHQSVENAMSCIQSSTGVRLDPLAAFKKINNESGFRPYYSYNGGHGIGQLIGGTAAGISQGREDYDDFMANIANSNDASCTDFKAIMQNDRTNPIHGRNAIVENGRCRFLSMGQGMQRSLIYSLMYRASLSKSMTSEFRRRFPNQDPESQQNRELIGNLVNIGYGPRGPRGALAVLQSAGRSSSPQVMQAAITRNPYIRAINGAYDQVLQLTRSSARTPEEKDRLCLAN